MRQMAERLERMEQSAAASNNAQQQMQQWMGAQQAAQDTARAVAEAEAIAAAAAADATAAAAAAEPPAPAPPAAAPVQEPLMLKGIDKLAEGHTQTRRQVPGRVLRWTGGWTSASVRPHRDRCCPVPHLQAHPAG